MPVPIPPASSVGATVAARARDAESGRAGAPSAGELPTTNRGFAQVVNAALDTVNGLEYSPDSVSRPAPAEEGSPAGDLRVAATESDSTTEVTVANRGRALASFNEILTMQM